MTSYLTVDSPIGPLTLTAEDGALTGVAMDARTLDQVGGTDGRRPHRAGGLDRPAPDRAGPAPERAWRVDRPAVMAAAEQLAAYFAGQLRQFDLALRPDGTAFQRAVWAQLGLIPYGEVVAYGEIARRMGRPGSSRAVGAANGRNPLAVVVPCHRVIGADGSLTGYGGGIWRKRWLLAHEGVGPAGLDGGSWSEDR